LASKTAPGGGTLVEAISAAAAQQPFFYVFSAVCILL